MKTNAVRALEKLGIAFELRSYDVDPKELGVDSVARKTGLEVGELYKTLVVRGDRSGVLLAVVGGDAALDLKALAKASGDRRVELVALAEVQGLTGYVRGGVTALAVKKPYPVFVDQRVLERDRISVSAGRRGLQILLSPSDYVRAVGATLAAISRSGSEQNDEGGQAQPQD